MSSASSASATVDTWSTTMLYFFKAAPNAAAISRSSPPAKHAMIGLVVRLTLLAPEHCGNIAYSSPGTGFLLLRACGST
jgi:hypothetical protein